MRGRVARERHGGRERNVSDHRTQGATETGIGLRTAVAIAAPARSVGRRWPLLVAVRCMRGRRQHIEAGEHPAPRPRHERAEAFEEGERVEDDVGGAVAIPLLQAIADATIGQQRQVVRRGMPCGPTRRSQATGRPQARSIAAASRSPSLSCDAATRNGTKHAAAG